MTSGQEFSPPSILQPCAEGINSNDDIIGVGINSGQQFLYSGGITTFLNYDGGPNYFTASTSLGGINDSDQIVGRETGHEFPLPAALPLFATGLGALGLLARRRKRKFGASA